MSTILLSTELGVTVLLNEGSFIMSLLLGYSGDQKSHIILIKDKNMGLLVLTMWGMENRKPVCLWRFSVLLDFIY